MTAATPGEPLIGSSAAMRAVLDRVKVAAASGANVLVCGEPGTGRELIARAIHAQGPDPTAPFVAINCASEHARDVETELFGIRVLGSRKVERRAFERITRSAGVFRASGGTLFLENVSELTGRVQLRLARLLRDHEAVIQHERENVDIRLRVVTAAPPRFDAAVQDGRLWGELHERLAAFRIDVPPLRSRREDIPDLTTCFLRSLCDRANLPSKSISGPAQSVLSALPWRGNADELGALLESLIVRVQGPTIDLDDVLASVQLDGQATWFPVGGKLRDARAQFEREYIAAVLQQHQGRIPDAARTLGIQRTNLYRKMKQLKVQLATSRRP